MDSNHRSETQQIYSLSPLATREISHIIKPTILSRLVFGAGGRTWTPDLLITNQLLYQLSYTSKFSFRSCIHSLISSAYIIYHILHHLSTLFSIFFNFFEAFPFFEDVLEWVSLIIISSPTLFVKGFAKKFFIVFFNKISYEFFVAPLLNCKPFGLQLN